MSLVEQLVVAAEVLAAHGLQTPLLFRFRALTRLTPRFSASISPGPGWRTCR